MMALPKGRHTEGWRAPETSADTEVGVAGALLRDRMCDLVRNNPHAAKAVAVLVNNIVGAGIMPQAAKGELDDRDRATALVFGLAREERDSWVNWPARVAALMAAELMVSCTEAVGHEVTIETAAMQKVLEAHVRTHLEELAQPRIAL